MSTLKTTLVMHGKGQTFGCSDRATLPLARSNVALRLGDLLHTTHTATHFLPII
jgi:hypothetical protein